MTKAGIMAAGRIAFQGEPGAYSHLACRREFPESEAVPCATFEDALTAIAEGRADLGMIPIENSLAGRVADIHHLLPESGLFIVGERFLRVRHQLMGLKTARLEDLTNVLSHTHALGQCRRSIRELGLKAEIAADTAGAARHVAEHGDPRLAAIASELAAEIYGLKILRADIEDAAHNTTRFVVLACKPENAAPGAVLTSLIFRVRNVPAALYKALGGFATNGVNITKLESYQIEGSFNATQFFADIEGHPRDASVARALEELAFFTSELRILGTYPADAFRKDGGPAKAE
jgi:prephenate dehydratase